MPADDALLFIDANKYLDLYRTVQGKKLLAPLGEQAAHIFVTQRVVEEVQRNKILVAAGFLAKQFGEMKIQTFNVPDHLFGTSAGQSKAILEQMSEIVKKIRKVNDEVDALAMGIMEQISRSEDEVSKALVPIFAKAVPHSQDELQRARDRRELGNPPGKSDNPIGDQLTWEQILTRFKGKKRLWIISRDGDYGTVFDGKGFLNRFLFDELCQVTTPAEAYLFEDTVEGIKHFAETTGVKAEKLPTPEESEEIKKEEDALPPLRAAANLSGFERAIREPGEIHAAMERMRGQGEIHAAMERMRGQGEIHAAMERMRGQGEIHAAMERMRGQGEIHAAMERMRGQGEIHAAMERVMRGPAEIQAAMERILRGPAEMQAAIDRALRGFGANLDLEKRARSEAGPAKAEELSEKPKE